MISGKLIAALAAGALIAGATSYVASAQSPGAVYVFHSAPAGTCPSLDWHVVVGANNALSGMIAWDDMKSMARATGSIGSNKTFHMDAKEVGGTKTATIDGQVGSDGWLTANIMGQGIDCKGIKVAIWRPTSQ